MVFYMNMVYICEISSRNACSAVLLVKKYRRKLKTVLKAVLRSSLPEFLSTFTKLTNIKLDGNSEKYV